MKALGFIALGLLAGSAFAQEVAPKISVKTTASKAGQPLAITVTVTFAEGLHGYQNPPSDPYENPVTLAVTGKQFKLLKVTYPKGVEFKQDDATKGSLVYMGKQDITAQISIPKKPGTYKIPLTVKYQQCTASTCFPPSSASIVVAVTVKP